MSEVPLSDHAGQDPDYNPATDTDSTLCSGYM